MTTRVTEGARPERHDLFLLGLPCSRARALPLLNLKKKRGCSQSILSPVDRSHLLGSSSNDDGKETVK